MSPLLIPKGETLILGQLKNGGEYISQDGTFKLIAFFPGPIHNGRLFVNPLTTPVKNLRIHLGNCHPPPPHPHALGSAARIPLSGIQEVTLETKIITFPVFAVKM